MQTAASNNVLSDKTLAFPESAGHPLLNREVTLSRFADDQELLVDIAAVFVKTVPQLVGAVTEAVARNDLTQAFHQAHSLKGAVAAFEAPQVLSAVLAVEAYAKNGDATATAQAWGAAKGLVEALLTELATLSSGGKPE
jgi:HPt (histidine-containing phosphotransfer) domain-containing protein